MTIRQGVVVRAAVLPGFEQPLVVEDLELLQRALRDVVVRPGAVEVCVTDSHGAASCSPPSLLPNS